MFSAISFGVLRRSAPSTSAIMRSRKDLPGSCVISTTIRSLSTRVPPVTAERSPPDSRMTGADSPVIADSSTEAMPSITVPSPGITSPASTTTTSPRCSCEAATSPPSCSRAVVSERIARSEAACARPRPSASASARLAKTTVSHSQTATVNVNQRGLVAAAQRLAAEELDQPRDRRDQRADLDHEHDRVADLHARVELRERAPDRRPQDLRREQGLRAARRRVRRGRWGGVSSGGHRRPVRALSLVVLTPGSPSRPRKRPSVASSTSRLTRASGSLRTAATRRAWMAALASRDVRVDARAGGRDGVDRDLGVRQPGLLSRRA